MPTSDLRRIWIEEGPCFEDWPDPADCRLVDITDAPRVMVSSTPDDYNAIKGGAISVTQTTLPVGTYALVRVDDADQ